MRAIQPEHRRRSRAGVVPFVLAAFALGGVAVVGGLWAAGVDLPFLPGGRVFHVAIPISARDIPAYNRVMREDLWDPREKALAYMRMPPDKSLGMALLGADETGREVRGKIVRIIDEGGAPLFVLADGTSVPLQRTVKVGDALMQPADIVNRVLRQEKLGGYGFREEDFFPPGTQPGMSAATPPGKRALTVESSRLIGAHSLNPGDFVELIANIPTEKLAAFDQLDATLGRLPGTFLAARQPPPGGKQSESRVIALEALVLQPARRRVVSDTSSSLTQGKIVQDVPIEEVVFALDHAEAARLTEAIGMGASVNCLVRSGQSPSEAVPAAPDGTVAVPLVGRPLIAYTRVSLEDFVDLKTRRHRVEFVPAQEAASQGLVVQIHDVVGRVLNRDMSPGDLLREGDLMPEGTAPGLDGAVPPGRRLFALDADKVDGAETLRFRQRIDLIASTPVDWSQFQIGRGTSRLISGSLAATALQEQFHVEPVVQGGIVIAPLDSPANPSAVAARMQGTARQEAPQQVLIAVTPEEAVQLRSKMSMNAAFTAVPRGREGDPLAEPQPLVEPEGATRIDPLANVRTIETISGSVRQTVIFVPDSEPRSRLTLTSGTPAQASATTEEPLNGAAVAP